MHVIMNNYMHYSCGKQILLDIPCLLELSFITVSFFTTVAVFCSLSIAKQVKRFQIKSNGCVGMSSIQGFIYLFVILGDPL